MICCHLQFLLIIEFHKYFTLLLFLISWLRGYNVNKKIVSVLYYVRVC